jgi:hypothetical protein
MGVLDDAIRDHLELKRRHGASEAEVAQEEAEALGPARRDFPAAAPPEQSAEVQNAEVQGEEAVAAEEAASADEPLAHEPDFEPGGVPEFEPIREPERAARPEPEPEPEEPVESEPDTRHPAPDTLDQDTEEHEAARPSSDDDVLEETPEFLQDAPEHDRLWFEQKPPRDFDFE